MQVYLDTEFVQTPDGPQFLSAAFLAQDDRALYAETSPAEAEVLLKQHPNEFIRDEVLPQFGKYPGIRWSELPGRLVEWLDSLGAQEIEVVYDYGSDYTLVERLLADPGVSIKTRLLACHVGYLLDDHDGKVAACAAWQATAATRGLSRHHALADAFALRARYAAVHPPSPSRRPTANGEDAPQ